MPARPWDLPIVNDPRIQPEGWELGEVGDVATYALTCWIHAWRQGPGADRALAQLQPNLHFAKHLAQEAITLMVEGVDHQRAGDQMWGAGTAGCCLCGVSWECADFA